MNGIVQKFLLGMVAFVVFMLMFGMMMSGAEKLGKIAAETPAVAVVFFLIAFTVGMILLVKVIQKLRKYLIDRKTMKGAGQ